MTYYIVDQSEHDDFHRGFIDIDGKELSIVINREGIFIDLYDDAGRAIDCKVFHGTYAQLTELLNGDN